MDTVAIERLTRISIENPLLPEDYVPWDIKPSPDDTFVPNHRVSIYGLPIQERVTPNKCGRSDDGFNRVSKFFWKWLLKVEIK